MDIQERVQLLSALDIGVAPVAQPTSRRSVAPSPTPITGSEECGLVVGSALYGCVDGLSVANKYAVVNSQLLAERAASARFDNESQPKEWFKRYLDVLRICGWTTQSSEFTTYNSATQTETIEQVTLGIIHALGGIHAAAYRRVICNSFAALRRHSRASVRFHESSTRKNSAQFRVMPCMQTPDEHVVMVLTSQQTSSKSVQQQVQQPGRFWEFNLAHHDMRYAAAECMLNMQVYNGAKAQIEKKLATNTASLIDALDLD